MTKQLLLAATALSAVALAGAAGAADITAASVSGVDVSTTPYVLALETKAGTANANIKTSIGAGDNVITAEPTGGSGFFDPGTVGTNYTATFTLTGATFSSAVQNSMIEVVGQDTVNCTVSAPNVVSGGGAGQNTVTVVFNVASNCSVGGTPTAPTGVSFDIPFTMVSASTSTVSAEIGFTIATTASQYGGAPGSVTLVTRANAYTVSASNLPQSASALPTQMALGNTPPAYTALLANGSANDNIIGSIKVATSGAVHADLSDTAATPALSYTAELVGDYSELTPHVAASDADALAGTPAAPDFVVDGVDFDDATLASTSANRTIYVTANGGSVTNPVSSTLSVEFSTADEDLLAPPADLTNVALETVGQEGSNFVAPWMPLNNVNNAGTLRLSNNGAASTGPITLILSSPNTTVAATSNTCSVTQGMLTADSSTLSGNGGIPANGAVFISGPQIANCFGTTAQNGDVRVIIQSRPDDLTAKVRIRNATSGATFESALGRLGDLGDVTF